MSPDQEAGRAVSRAAVEELCRRIGVGGVPVVRFSEGSVPVYAVGDAHVLKLFPEADGRHARVEERVLAHVQGRLPVPTPRLCGAGPGGDGWRFVLMSRLHGEDLAPAWGRVPRRHRERIVTEAGEMLGALHALDPEPLADVLGPADWGGFLDRQTAGVVERQRERGLADARLEQIPDFLASVRLPRAPRPVLLHTEVMRQHLLADADGWRLTGLIDFEPAMIGDPAYDFVAVGLFVTGGDPRLLGRLSKAYGRTFDPSVLLAYTLLHVYSDLPWYLREMPAPAGETLPALAEAWFGVA
ncbi:aminoglycoside 3'-phosphotransferase/choline kinase family protein [Streptomyces sp. SID9727]|uniref:phosphotransferase family protein n=1 Tax=Streptomyces sp. SID9727 TaxID=2706114 RepID=UPI0013C55D76|nr:aminoglycoside 3'-phosphotransferase/choline kinase family protein [Streptomyces sp. SID9727]NEC67821.1 phosphotransferase [Streptomyces sp. SID9727]